jgi:hypothetical protein
MNNTPFSVCLESIISVCPVKIKRKRPIASPRQKMRRFLSKMDFAVKARCLRGNCGGFGAGKRDLGAAR